MSSSFRALPGLFLRLSPSMESMAKLASVKTPSIVGDLTSETAVLVHHFSSESLVKPPPLRMIAVAEDVDSPKISAIAIRLSCMRSDLPDLSAGEDEDPDQSAPVYSVHSPRSLMLGTVSVLLYHNRGRTILVPCPSQSRVSPSLSLLPSSILGRRLYCTGQPKDGYAPGWDWDSLNAKFEQQGEWYKDFLRKEAEKQAIRDEEYLKFCREGKQLEYVKKGIEELSVSMKIGFMKMQEKFFNADKHLDKKVRDAFELTSSDILSLVTWLEMLAWDVEKLSAAARRKEAQLEDKEYFQRQMKKAFDKLPKPFIKAINRLRSFIPSASRWYPARKWYPVALGIYVMYHDGISPADLYEAFLQWHAESLKKLREKLKKSKSEDPETQTKASEEPLPKASAEEPPKASEEEPKASEEKPKASEEPLPKASAEEPPKTSEEPPKKS